MTTSPLYGRVVHTDRLTSSMVRVVLGGDGLAGYVHRTEADAYVNIALPPRGATYEMPIDLAEARRWPEADRPVRRRYTVRAWDSTTRQLTIDFVVHGSAGVGGLWAETATTGDVLQFEGPSGGYSPDPDVDWHLLVADDAAIPACANALEQMVADASVIALFEVDGPEHELAVDLPANGDLRWVHRSSDAGLTTAVMDLSFPPGACQAFVHGEAGMVRAVRKHLLTERGVAKSALSASPYWRQDLADEDWRAIKKTWQAEVEAEA